MKLRIASSLLVCMVGQACLRAQPSASRPTTTEPAVPRITRFQPGIRINWSDREVEVDCTVIMREGLIELFACCPQVREHESVVRIEARPLHLYHALGLIGLTPGHPIRVNMTTGEVQMAAGDPLDIQIRYSLDGRNRQEAIEHWMRNAPAMAANPAGNTAATRPAQPTGLPEPLPWVFAGSHPLNEGDGIGADVEGTVVAIVDFGSSLIALPESHSDSNAELWLEPNTARIPPTGTRCTLVLRRGPDRISVDAVGRIQLNGASVTLGELTRTLGQARQETAGLRVRVRVDSRCPAIQQRALINLLKSLDLPDSAIQIRQAPPTPPEAHDPQAMANWLNRHLTGADAGGAVPFDPENTCRGLTEDLRRSAESVRDRTAGVIDWIRDVQVDPRRFLIGASAGTSQPAGPSPQTR